eukprot:526741-Pelagomonas_calceolata.AAC.1
MFEVECAATMQREGKGYIAVPACGDSLAELQLEAKRACNQTGPTWNKISYKVYKDKAFSQEMRLLASGRLLIKGNQFMKEIR